MGTPIRRRKADHFLYTSALANPTFALPFTNDIVTLDAWMVKTGPADGQWTNQAGSPTPQYLSGYPAGTSYGGSEYRVYIGHRDPFDLFRIFYSPLTSPPVAAYVGNATWAYYDDPLTYGLAYFTPRHYSGAVNPNPFKIAQPYTQIAWAGGAIPSRPALWQRKSLFAGLGSLYWIIVTHPAPSVVGTGGEVPRADIYQGHSRCIERLTAIDTGTDGTILTVRIQSEFAQNGGDVFFQESRVGAAGRRQLDVEWPGGLVLKRNRNAQIAVISNATNGLRTLHVTASKEI